MKDFEGNECEWPLFYTFLIIDGVFKSNTEQIEEYQAELRKCMYADANGGKCIDEKSNRPTMNYIFSLMLSTSRSGNIDVLCT